MAQDWFYAENGETVGPVTAEALARRIRGAREQPLFVWAPGMAEWVDGRSLPEFAPGTARPPSPAAAASPAGAGAQPAKKKLVQRAREEFLSYLAVSAYLLIWFLAVLFYKSAVLRSVGIAFAPFGVAVVKALILGKFIVALEAVKLGEGRGAQATLAAQITIRAVIFTVALVLMSLVEEVVVGHFHGHAVTDTLGDISAWQLLANALLLFLVLLPYLAFRRLAQRFGALPELLFSRKGLETFESSNRSAGPGGDRGV
jgi:hypothetical protein